MTSSIPRDYVIQTTRSTKELAKVTVSGYNKTDVLQRLVERLRLNDIDQSNHWAAELVCSNHVNILFGKLVAFMAQEVNIQNPKLPGVALSHLLRYRRLNLDGSGRNCQEVRNMVAELTCVLALSPKKVVKFPKISELDFEVDYIKSRVMSTSTDLVDEVLRNGDPGDLVVPLNELATQIMLVRKYSGDRFTLLTREETSVNPYYWLAWFLEWEKNMSSKKMKDLELKCAPRSNKLYDAKFATDCVWAAWDLFESIANKIGDANVQQQMSALYELYAYDYSRNKRTEKRFLMYNAVQLLTVDFEWQRDVYVDRKKCVKMCACINMLYRQIAKDCRDWEEKYRKSTIASYISAEGSREPGTASSTKVRAQDLREVQEEIVRGVVPGHNLGVNQSCNPKTVDQMYMERELEYDRVPYDKCEERLHARMRDQEAANEQRHMDELRRYAETIESSEIPGDEGVPEDSVTLPIVCNEGAGCVFIPRDGVKKQRPPPSVVIRDHGNPNELREFIIRLSDNTNGYASKPVTQSAEMSAEMSSPPSEK